MSRWGYGAQGQPLPAPPAPRSGRQLERYLGLERYLESRLRPSQLWRALRRDKIDVRIEGARSYPEGVAHLKPRRWDVLLGFSPITSMEALDDS